MPAHHPAMHHYELTTVRSASHGPRGPVSTRVCLVGAPRVGQPLVMFADEGGRRIITSPVVRAFEDRAFGTYVETRNTVYLLKRTSTDAAGDGR